MRKKGGNRNGKTCTGPSAIGKVKGALTPMWGSIRVSNNKKLSTLFENVQGEGRMRGKTLTPPHWQHSLHSNPEGGWFSGRKIIKR